MCIYKIVFVVLLFGFCIVALYAPLGRVSYTITSAHITSPMTIALLSDLHSGEMYQEQIIQTLIECKLDAIVMSGDMVDDKSDMQGAFRFFAKLNTKPLHHIPKFYVSGNHEIWSYKLNAIKEVIQGHNIVVLDFNKPLWKGNINGNTLIIGGVDDPYIVRYQGDDNKLTPYSKN